jgi:uncharacterized protein YbjT (DUF2867 family)
MPASHARKTVLVAGATGRLGIVVELLLARGHAVRAMTRELDSPAAQRLRVIGAEVRYDDFEDPASIQTAAANVAAAAAAASVEHLIYSSGDGASPDSPLPLFQAKFRVEQHIRSLPIAHTILAPVYFMENHFTPWNTPGLRSGRFPSPIRVEQPLQQVAIADVAAFAALVIERPHEFAGQRIRLASDELSAERAAAALSSMVGRQLEAEQLPAEEQPPSLRAVFAWLEHPGHNVDIAQLRRRYPEVGWHDCAAWLRSKRSRLHGLCPTPQPALR